MTKSALVRRIARRHPNLQPHEAEHVVEAIFKKIEPRLLGDRIEIRVGTFSVSTAARGSATPHRHHSRSLAQGHPLPDR
jgi:nucleoid DNA-binding protein